MSFIQKDMGAVVVLGFRRHCSFMPMLLILPRKSEIGTNLHLNESLGEYKLFVLIS